MDSVPSLVGGIGIVIELAGVVTILLGLVYAIVRSVQARLRRQDGYRTFRQVFGRGLFFGLEIVVAAAIVKLVALKPTLTDIATLGLLVLVWTFLGWVLTVELEGRWPWQSKPGQPASHAEPDPSPIHDVGEQHERSKQQYPVAAADVPTSPTREATHGTRH